MTGRDLAALRGLAGLARLVLDSELVALRRRQEALARTQARLADLATAVERQAAIVAQDLEAPVAGPVHARWGAWVEVRRIELNRQLAVERAEAEAARQAARDAFGRAEALRGMLEAETKAARKAALERARRRGG
ncbi:MAG: hypothetical protein N2Z62_16530 [Rhodobacteraceae bacterium]|nr:hypothetical protein [Paracoccaceae bacterium]